VTNFVIPLPFVLSPKERDVPRKYNKINIQFSERAPSPSERAGVRS